MLGKAIRNAQSSHAVLFFLTTYLENQQDAAYFPPHVSELPLGGLHDVMGRLDALVGDLEKSIRDFDFQTVDAIAEAVRVFDAAVIRLIELKGKQSDRLTEGVAA